MAETVTRWRLRLQGGRVQLSDATLGVSLDADPMEPHPNPNPHPNPSPSPSP